MNPATKLRNVWRRISGMDLQQCHTAIAFHWSDGTRQDQTFMLRGIHRGEQLHQYLDALLEEHSYSATCDTVTDVTIFWHTSDGRWDCEELQSHYCCGPAARGEQA